jgi:hypothetical protein
MLAFEVLEHTTDRLAGGNPHPLRQVDQVSGGERST